MKSSTRNVSITVWCSRLPLIKRWLGVFIGVSLQALLAQRVRGENHADYKYEDYREESGRIHVRTHGVLAEFEVSPAVSVHGELVFDAISGATPTGGPAPTGSKRVPVATMDDERTAGNLQVPVKWGGRHTTTPQLAYSLEGDYESVGFSLNHTIDFNDKNTTLALGFAYTYDTIMPDFWFGDKEYKNSGDVLIGVTQLLGPKTILTANLTLGAANGYMNDPYKGVRFDDYPDPNTLFREKRPGYRDKQIGYLALTHFVTPLKGSAELVYRFYHDSYNVASHTMALTWYQKLGKHIVVAPTFRFVDQTAASFYGVRFAGDASLPSDDPFYVPIPKHYSADYRLSAMQTFTYGLSATWKIKDRVSLDFAYKRYDMIGKDNATAKDAYPNANVFSGGVRVWF